MFKILGSAEPKYLAATDFLIGDMSNINYEFLLYDKPIILLANDWLTKNFPDIGIKCDIRNINSAIIESIKTPDLYSLKRKLWLERTISYLNEPASKRYIDIMLHKSGLLKPSFLFFHGDDSVRKTNLIPLVKEVSSRNFNYNFVAGKQKNMISNSNTIIVGAHYADIPLLDGYRVHIDHDLKGISTANLEYGIWDYKKHKYFPHIDLHIVAGKAGDKRTKLVLGPYEDRTIIAGYPKGDHFLKLNTQKNKDDVYNELGFKKGIPLVTYAPAGKCSFMKPGGSLNNNVIYKLMELSKCNNFHVLVKMKYDNSIIGRVINILKDVKRNYFGKKIYDDGSKWRSFFAEEDAEI